MQTAQKISAKEAAGIAKEHLCGLIDAGRILLEEAELTDDKRAWLITLSFDERIPDSPLGMKNLFSPAKREYKQFEIDRETGEVRSMRIRVLA